MTSSIPSSDHISSLAHLLDAHLDEELGGELNRAGLGSRLSAQPVCTKMRLGKWTVPGVPCGGSGSPRTDRLPDTGGQEPFAGGHNKRGPTRLGLALRFKFFELEARFPRPARRRHRHQHHVGERGG